MSCLTLLFILRLFYYYQFYINVCAEFINYIIDCNKATAKWTGLYIVAVHDWSIKFL